MAGKARHYNYRDSSLDYTCVDYFFKEYFGEQQHIRMEKNIEKSDVKHIRELFRN